MLPPLVVVAMPVVVAPFAYVASRDIWRVRRSMRLLSEGSYADARVLHERIAQSWMRVLPGVAQASRYSIALARHMEGDFEGALHVLSSIDRRRLDANLGDAVTTLEATSLVLLGRDIEHAAALLEASTSATSARPPEDLLFLAVAKQLLGDVREAGQLLERAGTERSSATPHHRAIFHTMRGLLLVALGHPERAVTELERASEVPLQNWYTLRARALLPPPGRAEIDPRSSLAPTVSEP